MHLQQHEHMIISFFSKNANNWIYRYCGLGSTNITHDTKTTHKPHGNKRLLSTIASTPQQINIDTERRYIFQNIILGIHVSSQRCSSIHPKSASSLFSKAVTSLWSIPEPGHICWPKARSPTRLVKSRKSLNAHQQVKRWWDIFLTTRVHEPWKKNSISSYCMVLYCHQVVKVSTRERRLWPKRTQDIKTHVRTLKALVLSSYPVMTAMKEG